MARSSSLDAKGISPSAIVARSSAASTLRFLDYSQEQLDKAYDQSSWAPEMTDLETHDGTASAAVRRTMPPRTEHYGPSDVELMDIFTPDARGVPILVFIHGGAWMGL